MGVLHEIDYPSSDGKPMAETPLHMRVMIDVIEMLIAWFAADPNVYVWGNLFVYYVEGDITKNFSPDVMVVKGVERDKPRDVFKIWEEGRGPSVVIEVTSRKTRAEDLKKKLPLYRDVVKVREYFLFDPKAPYLKPPLQGFRLWRGVYRPIRAVAGRLPSLELGLHLEQHGQELRLWDPAAGKWLPTKQEALDQIDQARLESENARLESENARLQAEAENARLRREIEAIRKRNGA